jgi:hypothetical protein
MMSIWKRAAAIGAAAAMIGTAGPGVALASAATFPSVAPVAAPVGPIGGAYQAGAIAAIGGLNAGADAAVGGWNAGLTAMGVPFQFAVNTWGPLHVPGIASLPAIP